MNPRNLYFNLFGLLCFLISSVSYATNGYFLHGFGKNKGRGGSGIAQPQDALAAATNPAGMVWVGDRFDLTADVLIPSMGYKFKGLPEVNSEAHMFGITDGYFVIPAMGVNFMLNDNTSIGYSLYGAGIGTDYRKESTPSIQTLQLPNTPAADQLVNTLDPNRTLTSTQDINGQTFNNYTLSQPINGTFFNGDTGVDLLLLMNNISIAHKFSEDFSAGAGLIIGAQSFKARGLLLFTQLSESPENVHLQGRDWAFAVGANFGFQYRVAEDVSLAFMYQTELDFKQEKHKGLLAEQGGMKTPQNATAGVAFEISENTVFTFDFQWINYSGVNAIGNTFSDFDLITITGTAILDKMGSESGPGFGWEDAKIFKLGLQWKFDDDSDWTWRAGYSYMNQIEPGSETLMGLLAPAVVTDHYTFGFTWDVDEGNEFNFEFLYAPRTEVAGENVTFSQSLEYIYLEEYSFEFGWGYKFGN